MGSRCLPGLVVLSFSPMVNTYLSGSSCMREMSSFVKVWHRCPVRRQSNIVSFLVRILISSSAIGCNVVRYCKTVPTSQILVYLGKDGLSSNTPLRNLVTSGCVPNVFPSGRSYTDDRADLAELMALYPRPF